MAKHIPLTSNWINYHHLYYFWVVATYGSVTEAGRTLRVAQPTISAQMKALEEALGEKLFERAGRRLRLSEVGKLVFRYAEQIFSLGHDLLHTLRVGTKGYREQLRVGIHDSLPKTLMYELLAPVYVNHPQTTIVCLEGTQQKLLSELAIHELDIVVSDTPFDHSMSILAFNHHLGSSGTSFFATPSLAKRIRSFPKSLHGAPFLLPSTGATQRRVLDRWFIEMGIIPQIVGEFEDSALMKAFGQKGIGIFVGPTAIENSICSLHGAKVIGRAPDARVDVFAISVERRITHPAVAQLCGVARDDLFAVRSGKLRRTRSER